MAAPSTEKPDDKPKGKDQIVTAALDAAERLYARDGVAAVSLRGIATEAGITYSLLNRHLGTKEQIFDQLLARSEERWKARVDGMDFGQVLQELMGPNPDAGSYLRLLASSLLANQGIVSDAHREHSQMHQLIPLAAKTELPDGLEPTTAAAMALSLIYGWRLFNPFIVSALKLGDDPTATQQLHQAITGFATTALAPGS